jgi:hypothetical protein
MKLIAAFTLLGSMAAASCGSDARSPSSPSTNGGSGGSGGSAASGAGSTALGSGSSSPTVAGSGGAPAAGSGGLPALQECTGSPSIDRVTSWTATSGECVCTPVGNLLTQDGQANVAKVEFMGGDWHVVPVLITNKFGTVADLSAAPGITLTYSATAALHVQVRAGGSNWSGGDKWAADVPATAGAKQTLFIPFEPSKWASLFGAPALPFADTLKVVQGLVFVGNTANTVVFYGLRMQGFEPACP